MKPYFKTRSIRQKVDDARARHIAIANEVANYDREYTIIEPDGTCRKVIKKATDYKFGIFNKKGYRPVRLYETREEAENDLKTWRKPEYYEIREILEW